MKANKPHYIVDYKFIDAALCIAKQQTSNKLTKFNYVGRILYDKDKNTVHNSK